MKDRLPASWQEVKMEGYLLRHLMDQLPDDEKLMAASWLCVEMSIAAGDNPVEWLGIIEMAKTDLLNCISLARAEREGENESE